MKMKIIFKRALSSLRPSIIDKCPPPTFDSGCTYCKIPEFPADKQIDFQQNLNGTVAKTWKHLMVVSKEPPTKWPSKLEMDPKALISEFTPAKRKWQSPNHPVAISNIYLGEGAKEFLDKDKHTVLLFPDRKLFKINTDQVTDFFKKHLVPQGQEKIQVYNPFAKEKNSVDNAIAKREDTEISNRKIDVGKPFDHELAVICGHGSRDIRCGVLAPLIKNELDKVLRHHNLNDKVLTGYISHVGGHAYAGNFIYYGENTNFWYGRVFPENIQGIVAETILKGNIIRELSRYDVD